MGTGGYWSMREGIRWRAAARTAAALGLALLAFPLHASTSEAEANRPIVVTGVLAPNLFGTATVPVALSRYSADWARAKRTAFDNPQMMNLIAPARALPREQQVAYIQSAVHQRIRWMSDATEWGHHDYWASASETLAHGAGDMEDRAIVKMQALRALGFRPGDLILTMGKDKVGGQITVLIVRTAPNRYLTLDDLGGTPIPSDRRQGFTPLMSFSADMAWLHGKRIANRAATPAQPAGTRTCVVAWSLVRQAC